MSILYQLLIGFVHTGKITKKDNIAVQAQPIDSLDKSKTKLNINSKQENQHLLSKNIKSNVKDTKHSISSVNATAGKKIVFPCKSFVPNVCIIFLIIT